MAQQDLISINIGESDLAEIRTAIATLERRLMPYLQVFTAEDLQEMPKMGDKTIAFVQKSLEYAEQNPELTPSYLSVESMAIDIKAVQSLRELMQRLTPISAAVNDSLVVSGSEAYQGALVFYNNLKYAAKVKTPKAKAIYDDLSARFPGKPSKKHHEKEV